MRGTDGKEVGGGGRLQSWAGQRFSQGARGGTGHGPGKGCSLGSPGFLLCPLDSLLPAETEALRTDRPGLRRELASRLCLDVAQWPGWEPGDRGAELDHQVVGAGLGS